MTNPCFFARVCDDFQVERPLVGDCSERCRDRRSSVILGVDEPLKEKRCVCRHCHRRVRWSVLDTTPRALYSDGTGGSVTKGDW